MVIGSLLSVTDPRVEIAVEAANGRTAAELADQVALDFSLEGEPGAVSIGGVHATMLDKLPGQEINRQLFFDHQGLIYRLTFLPADENLAAYEAMAQLCDMVLASFAFIPVAQDLAAGYDCLQPKAGEVTLTNSDLGFCLLHPEGYSAEDTDENQTVLYVDSLLSVSHPKLFIEVSDAGGQDAQALAEVAAAELEAVMPGLTLGRTFGLSIGYEPAFVLDDVPGQDISRQVFAVQGDRLYRLTFVPASEDAGEVYAEMEGLYGLVTRSFRFLR
jgi:hypothetical protein